MKHAAAHLQFEEAAELRDAIRALEADERAAMDDSDGHASMPSPVSRAR